MGDTKSQPQTLHHHIKELRSRLVRPAIVFLLAGVGAYTIRQPLIALLQKPIHETLYYTSPAGAFNFVMKICTVVGLTFALPVLVYNLIRFIQPAFPRHISGKVVKVVTGMSVVLALAGGAFGFLVVVPMSLHFFSGFGSGSIRPLITASDYLNFVVNCILSFMLIFQIPMVVLFIDRIKPLPPKQLFKYEKYVIVGSFAIALVLPFTYDPLTQFLIALPMILLYNLSIVFILITRHKTQGSSAKKPTAPAYIHPKPYNARAVAQKSHTSATPAHAVAAMPKVRRVQPSPLDIVKPLNGPTYPTRMYQRQEPIVLPRTNFLDLRQIQTEPNTTG